MVGIAIAIGIVVVGGFCIVLWACLDMAKRQDSEE